MEVTVEDIKFSDVDITNPDILKARPYNHRRSTVFVEFTDKNISDVDIQRAMQAGATGLKFKSGYTTRSEKCQFLSKVERAKAWCETIHSVDHWPVATCVTLKTCMVKTGLLENEEESIQIVEGSEVILTNNPRYIDKCNANRIFIDNPQLTIEMKRGMEVNLSQAEVILEVVSLVESGRAVRCRCTQGGRLRSMVSVSVRDMRHTRPYITKQDLHILKFAVDYQIDIVVINYVRNVETIKKARNFLNMYSGGGGGGGGRPLILAGVCTLVGLENVHLLIKECDGLIIARDYLPYELPKHMEYRLPMIQKYLGGICLRAGKPFFISGGVFAEGVEKGVLAPREIADVTNATLDGASGFIVKDCLSVEHTLAVLAAIHSVCCYVEPITAGRDAFWGMVQRVSPPANAAAATALAAVLACSTTGARVLALPTATGRSVRLVLLARPAAIVLAVSRSARVVRHLRTHRAVVPLLYTDTAEAKGRHSFHKAVQARLDLAVEYAVSKGWLKPGDTYVSMQRSTYSGCYCDMVRIWAATTSTKPNVECPSEYDFTKKRDSKAKRKSQEN